ncbi:hypothetical protein [Telluribacter sp. SYSU D00476]|nr:hypothetical protein [Telluribacter sp. SYSU D00476]
MKKVLLLAAVGGMLWMSSCARKVCPAYGSTHKVEKAVSPQRA